MKSLSALMSGSPETACRPVTAWRKWLASSLAFLTLSLVSAGASANTLDVFIADPDCDSQTIKMTWEAGNLRVGDTYQLEWAIIVTPADGSGPPVVHEDFHDFVAATENVMEMLTIDVPELAGATVIISGRTKLWSLTTNTLFNRVVVTNPDGETDFLVDCTPPPTASLGDRVWEDRNNNGIQDCGDDNDNGTIGDPGDSGPECDAGIPDVPVDLLFGDCTTPTGMQAFTDANGFYLFENLAPGDYCVDFGEVPAGICVTDGYDLGSPLFTTPNAGDDDVDSDADENGVTDATKLSAGETDLTIDAGVVCPVKIGDLVFLDDNQDGIQDPGEPGVPDVKTTLYACGPDMISGTPDDVMTGEMRWTDGGGMYMYGAEPGFVLDPGKYYVQFDLPDGYSYTTPGAGGDDTVDSDCLPDTGITACTDLTASRTIDLNRDCGIVPPPPPRCDLSISKTCAINEPPPSDYQCTKPIDSLSMIWNGQDNVRVVAYKGGVGATLLADVSGVNNGDTVTVNGFAGSPNDVYWEIFAADGSKLGESVFHLSCSDDDMNGPEDCGKPQGDGKGGKKTKSKDDGGDSGDRLNDWILEGIVDAGGVLSCSGGGGGGSDPDFPTGESCSFTSATAEVIYGYAVTNNGDGLTGLVVTDDKLGSIGGPVDLGNGETVRFTASATLSGTTTNVGTASADLGGAACVAMDTLTVEKFVEPGSCDDGKATELVFEYTGESCAATTNEQEGKFECSPDDVPLGDISGVEITKDEDKVSAEVSGGIVRIFRSGSVGEKLAAETRYTITDATGLTQDHVLHTSCSKRLDVGDQFGALKLIQLINEF